MHKQEKSFVKGAVILASAGIITKILGAVYRIPLYNLIGDVGMGYFQMVYPIYAALLAISTAGIPVAVSKMVAERMAVGNVKGAYQILKVALTLMLVTGLFFSLLLYFGAEYYANRILGTPLVVYSLKSVAPGIFLVVIMAAFRGFFQGNQTMIPTALSQVVEQIIRVITIFYLSWLLLPKGVEFAAAGATFGVVTGSLSGVAVLLIFFLFHRSKTKELSVNKEIVQISAGQTLKQMLLLALPITLGSLVLPLIQMADATILPRRLQTAGFSREEAAALIGHLTGAAMPLVNVPTLFTIAIAQSLVPSISEANALQNIKLIKSRATLAIKLTLLIGLPSAVGLFVLANPISIMLYNDLAVAVPLVIVCFAIIFLTLQQTTSALLQGLGKTVVPVVTLLMGVLLKVILNYFLSAIPVINIKGAAIGTVASYLVSSTLNLVIFINIVGLAFSIMDFVVKPLITSGGMGLTVYLAYPLTFRLISRLNLVSSERLAVSGAVLVSVGLGVVVYGLLLLLSGAITQKDLESIPKIGHKLTKILIKLKIFR
ncbi:putative polysaccharide biosynthesis protein [Anaerobranca gottschalkii]|uniref:Stage V sporulation protein B n=1 Tax=Anaerobranca gottschalkii DSM 13577 TaxID=1120990 RepID=A0A1I0CW14_9FIRM|nr:polysaccharide biosynthesis protein [Anaerobranca gottschalkii]SET23762.1 stage V sporulation protein B [Anaerobranca gottschalkii DSM 13577]